MQCNFQAYYGLSLFFEYLTVIQNNPNITYNIQFTPKLIEQLRSGETQYYQFLKQFLILECDKLPNAHFSEGDDFPLILPSGLDQEVTPTSFLYSPQTTPPNLEKDYVVVNTKILVGVDGDIKNIWDSVKIELFKILSSSNLKLVIIGEQSPMDCKEYKGIGTFSIYNDLVNSNFPNLLDLTSKNTLDLYKPEIITSNMNILSHSKFNIHIGEGGGLRVYRHTNNVLALTSHGGTSIPKYKPKFIYESTIDKNNFLELLTTKFINL
jgi:hypothetical protein